MLQCKDINKIPELKNGFTPMWLEPDFISSSLKCFSFSKLCQIVSEVKGKGYSFKWIMTILLLFSSLGHPKAPQLGENFIDRIAI